MIAEAGTGRRGFDASEDVGITARVANGLAAGVSQSLDGLDDLGQ